MCKVFCEIFSNIFVIFAKYFHNFPRASFVRFSHLFFAFIVHIIWFRFCWNCRIGLQCFIYKFLPQFEGFYRYPHCLIVMRPTHRSHRYSRQCWGSGREIEREILLLRKRVAITEAVDGFLRNFKMPQIFFIWILFYLFRCLGSLSGFLL